MHLNINTIIIYLAMNAISIHLEMKYIYISIFMCIFVIPFLRSHFVGVHDL